MVSTRLHLASESTKMRYDSRSAWQTPSPVMLQPIGNILAAKAKIPRPASGASSGSQSVFDR
jgi:hypothetical protein